MEPRLAGFLQLHRHHRLRHPSAIVGTPSTRTPPPCGLGISTARTGGGKYEPELIRFQILIEVVLQVGLELVEGLTSSTPGAPLLAATRRYASHTICLGMSNGLTCDVGMFSSLPPGACPG